MDDGDESADLSTTIADFDFENFNTEIEFNLGEDTPDIETTLYPSVSDIMGIHDDIIEEDEDASEGVLDAGSIDFAVQMIEHGHFGQVPETIHEKAFELMRLLAANHGFADGNKRTALNTTWTFYAMNGLYFDYGEEIKAILKLLAVKEEMVDKSEAVSYFSEIAYEADNDRARTEITKLIRINAWEQDLETRVEELLNADIDAEEYASRLSRLLAEQLCHTSEAVAFKNEYEEQIPDETVEWIEAHEESMSEFVDWMEDMSVILAECDSEEEYRNRREELFEDPPWMPDG